MSRRLLKKTRVRPGSFLVVDRDKALAKLPTAYAEAIRLREQGIDDASIASFLGLEPEAMDSLFRLAEAKLKRLVGRR